MLLFEQVIVVWVHSFVTQEQLYKNTCLTFCIELGDSEFSSRVIEMVSHFELLTRTFSWKFFFRVAREYTINL